MSPPVDTLIDTGEDLTAAEYALGVLDTAERGAAERRLSTDTAFARDVERWDARLTPLTSDIASAVPRDDLWRDIERRLDTFAPSQAPAAANVVDLNLRRSLATWRAAAVAASALAAVLIATLVWPRPEPTPRLITVTKPQLVAVASPAPAPSFMTARLATKGGDADFVVALERTRSVMVVTPASIAAVSGRSPELWLLPTGGKPRALGVVSFTRAIHMTAPMSLGRTGRLALAISIEPLGGSTTGQPTGPVVATGELQRT